MIKKIVIIVCSTILFVIAVFFGIRFYSRYSLGYTKVYVASHNIAQRTLITEEDLQEIEVPKDYLKDNVYIGKEDILGKYVKLSYSIPKGCLIYKNFLESDIKDLAHTLLKEGEVNYDLYTNDVKINTANLAKNMYVDIYLTINKNDKPISDLLISNARITGLYDSNNKSINDYDNDSKIAIITVAIDKDDINYLNQALVLGDINCVVNNNTYSYNLRSILNNSSRLFDYMY